MRPKILVSRKISDLAEEKLQKEFEVTLNPKDEPISESDLIKIVNDYDGMISTGFDKITENFGYEKVIIDASSAHRVSDGWEYGFPELNSSQRHFLKKSK